MTFPQVDLLIGGSLLIGGVIVLSCALQLLFRKAVGEKTIKQCHEVGSDYFSVVGTFYAVLLGLIIFDAQSRFEESKNNLETEASSAMILYVNAGNLPNPYSTEIRKHFAAYVDRVLNYEWDTMTHGVHDPLARDELVKVTELIGKVEPVTEGQKTIYDKIHDNLSDVWKMRRQRIDDSAYNIPRLEWIALVVGGVVTIFFGFFFVMDRVFIQLVMNALVTLVISLNIYLVWQYGNPYSGEIRILKNSYEALHTYIKNHP